MSGSPCPCLPVIDSTGLRGMGSAPLSLLPVCLPYSLTHGFSKFLLSIFCIPATVLGARCSQNRNRQEETMASLTIIALREQAMDRCAHALCQLVLSALEKRKAGEGDREC